MVEAVAEEVAEVAEMADAEVVEDAMASAPDADNGEAEAAEEVLVEEVAVAHEGSNEEEVVEAVEEAVEEVDVDVESDAAEVRPLACPVSVRVLHTRVPPTSPTHGLAAAQARVTLYLADADAKFLYRVDKERNARDAREASGR